MSERTRVSHPNEPLLSTDVKGFDSLAELAGAMLAAITAEPRVFVAAP
jgi:hypothetical protein